MRLFNLEEAKKGVGIVTRKGKSVRILCFDCKGEYPIVGLVDNGNEEEEITTTLKGRYANDKTESENDLFMAPTKKTGWVNIYRDRHRDSGVSLGYVYKTKEEAERANKLKTAIDCIKIEWEE